MINIVAILSILFYLIFYVVLHFTFGDALATLSARRTFGKAIKNTTGKANVFHRE